MAPSTRPRLADHRPHEAAAGNPFLFAGQGQNPLCLGTLRAGFQDSIARLIGIEVYPHAMRHFAAWLFLQGHPGQYETVRRILGHRDVSTTIRFYCGLEAEAAAMLFDEAITQERKGGRLLARAGFRRGGMAGPPKAGPKAPAGKKGR